MPKNAAHTPEVPADSITEGSVKVGGQSIDYRAIAGTLTVGSSDPQDAMIGFDGRYLPDASIDLSAKPEDRPATTRMFYVAYFAKNPAKNRPITFLYNGGPGSATMYLHMGAFGPERLVLPQDSEHQEGAPYQVVPNEYSLLDASDLVFIDAPGTGFSRIYGKEAAKQFYGTDPDAHAFDRFIRRFLSKYDRWNSPKYLFGESYGTTRTAILTNLLQRNLDLNGSIFLSQILSFDSSADSPQGNPGTDNGYFLALPSMAATAWYHHRVPNQAAELEPFLKTVEQLLWGHMLLRCCKALSCRRRRRKMLPPSWKASPVCRQLTGSRPICASAAANSQRNSSRRWVSPRVASIRATKVPDLDPLSEEARIRSLRLCHLFGVQHGH